MAEVDTPAPDPSTETEVDEEVTEVNGEVTTAVTNLASCIVPCKESESVSAVEENPAISLSELEQVLPVLPPKLSQVPPRPPLSRSKPTCSQSFSATPPRPPAMQPKLVHRAQSSVAPGLPPVPPRRALHTMATIHSNPSTLSSLQQPAATPSMVVPHPHPSVFSRTSPDAGALGGTFNYVYFTEDAVPPPTQLVAKSRKLPKYPPDVNVFGGRRADIGKKLADCGLGTPSYSSSDGYETNPAGSYVRLAVSSPHPADDLLTLHDYCYPSIDAVVPAPTASACRIEPQHSPPPLPMKSRRVGWWDCRWRRPRGHSSQLRAVWSQRSTTYGTESSVVASHMSLNNSQSSSLNTRRPPAAWRSRLLCFVRTCMHPCRWRRRRRQLRRAGLARCREPSTGHL